jgi:hypothetical protein
MTALDKDLLGIYLNDHLAGASAGLELARRPPEAKAATVPRCERSPTRSLRTVRSCGRS